MNYIRSGLRKSKILQYNNITTYDMVVNYTADDEEQIESDLREILTANGCDFVSLTRLNVTYQMDNLQVADLLCCDIKEIEPFFRVNDWKTGEPSRLSDKGVLIQRRIAETYGIGVGYTFTIAVNGTKEEMVRVDGIFENYSGRFIIISPGYYRKLYGEEPAHNAFYVRLNGADADALEEKLMSVEGYEGMTRADADAEIVDATTSSINTMVAIFIFLAGVMAGVVQLNLTNMYIMQKKPELIIMRVNGFTTKETIHYVLRETVVTTVLGILLGIGVGAGVAYRIIRTLEQSFFQFYRGVDPAAWAIGAALTVLFTVVVNAIVLRKTKDLKLTDAA